MGVQTALFVLITCFYGAYFYKQFNLRKKGIHTNRLAKGNKPKRTAIIEMCLLVSTYLSAAIQYTGIFFSRFMFPLSLPTPANIAGLVITACGVAFFGLAITQMSDNWRASVDESQKTAIVTGGIYRFSRNPAFVGFNLLYIGTALATPNIIIVLAVVSNVLLFHLQILEEEKYLSGVFGGEYEQYKANTPRYFLFI